MFIKVNDKDYVIYMKKLLKSQKCRFELVGKSHYKIWCLDKNERLMATREIINGEFVNYVWEELSE